jgi:DNA-binding Lrp family transcriptional regulator
VRRLSERGVLRGAHAEVALSALGIGLEAMIGVQLRGHSRTVIDSFQATTRALPEVVAIYYLAGAIDFMIHVAVRDSDHLRDFTLDAITSRPDVARVETALIFDHARSPTLPDYALSEPDPA